MKIQEDEEFEDEDELDEDEIDEDEEEIEAPVKKSARTVALAKKTQKSSYQPKSASKNKIKFSKKSAESDTDESKDESENPIKRRYAIVAPQPIRIIDAEAEEVIGEGDYAVLQALTDVIERLERIENTIGSLVEQ